MKNKKYFVGYSLIEIINFIIMYINAGKIAESQLATLGKVSADFGKIITPDMFTKSIRFSLIICIISVLVFMILAIKEKISNNKGLAFTLVIIPILFASDIVSVILGIAAFVMLSKEKTIKKDKKKLEKLPPLKVTPMNIIMSVITIIVYFGALFLAGLFSKKSYGIYVDIISKIVVLAVLLFTFKDRYKRDFKEFKNNFSTYLVFVLKCWGLMFLLAIITVFIRAIFKTDIIPANQQELNKLSILYLFPMAVIWAPIVEEGIFRGCLKRFIPNEKVFIVVSTVIFGLLHTVTIEIGIFHVLIQSLQYMAMGFVLSYCYVKTNNICANTSLHFFQNLLAVIMSSIMF